MADLNKILLSVLLLGVVATALPTHEEVISALSPKRDEIRRWFTNRVIGQSRGSSGRGDEDNLLCGTCELGVNLIYSFLDQGTPEEVEQGIIDICKELEILSPEICDGALRRFFPHAYYILTQRTLAVNDICPFLIQNQNCGVMNETMTNWKIIIDANKPSPIELPDLPKGIPTTKILHLTDIHLDLDYVVGSNTNCGKPLCCHRGEDWDEPSNSSEEAGIFGDYNCDIPTNTMDDLYTDSANRYDNYKFVILGGDYVHHGVWLTTKEENIRHFTSVAENLHRVFPDTPIYPIVGNHENNPTNVYPPFSVWDENPVFHTGWVYETLGDLFETKLTPEALVTFRRAGYYTISPEKGLRVITLNTNFCYNLNFWLLFDPIDPEDQLQWFSDQMHGAEQANEKVFILGHIPPGRPECWSVWNSQFNAVVDRYQNIIVGQFYGHTHNDDFKIYFDEERPSASVFISPSVTPYTDVNPGYKIFHFDGEREDATWEMVDSEVWIYNLTEANSNKVKPNWYQLYNTKEAYGLNSLRPDDLLDFVLRMAVDKILFNKFHVHFNKNSDTYEQCDDDICRREFLCALLTANHNDTSKCSLLDNVMRRH